MIEIRKNNDRDRKKDSHFKNFSIGTKLHLGKNKTKKKKKKMPSKPNSHFHVET